MEIIYEFDDDDFIYDADIDEVRHFLIRTYDFDELLDLYNEYLYSKLPQQNQEEYMDEYGYDGTEESIKKMSDDSKKILLEDEGFLDELIDLDIFNRELERYFYYDAMEVYNDEREYSRDPYAYNGVNRSDFF